MGRSGLTRCMAKHALSASRSPSCGHRGFSTRDARMLEILMLEILSSNLAGAGNLLRNPNFFKARTNHILTSAPASVISAPNPGGVAQLVEHLLCKQRVIGSNPFASTISALSKCILKHNISEIRRACVTWGKPVLLRHVVSFSVLFGLFGLGKTGQPPSRIVAKKSVFSAGASLKIAFFCIWNVSPLRQKILILSLALGECLSIGCLRMC